MTYRFREAREKAGLSTLEVAKRIDVSQTESQYGTRIKAGASSIAFMIMSSSWMDPRLFWRKL